MPFEGKLRIMPGYEIGVDVGYSAVTEFNRAPLGEKTGHIIDPTSGITFPFTLSVNEDAKGRGRNKETNRLLLFFVGDQSSTHKYALAITHYSKSPDSGKYTIEFQGTGEESMSMKLNGVGEYQEPAGVIKETEEQKIERVGNFVNALADALNK